MNDTVVVVTGMGVVSALGCSTDAFWENCKKGVSGAGLIGSFDSALFHSRIACEASLFDPDVRIPKKQSRRLARFSQFAVYAAIEAVAQAGLDIASMDPSRIGCLVGSAAGGYDVLEEQFPAFIRNGPQKGNPFSVPKTIANMASCAVAINLGITGPNFAILSACATGGHNLAIAKMMIQSGYADVVIAGGTEAAVTPMVVDSYGCMGVLSTRNDDPCRASRPFDRDRDGFVIGEGAGIMVLESAAHAKKRGAEILGAFSGFGMTCDAQSIAIPDAEGRFAAQAMRLALRDGGVSRDAVGYINAHGTSTHANDLTETRAIRLAFESAADSLSVSSTKSMIGHTLGAAGAIEAIACVLSLRDNIVPPTINLENPDPECDLDYTPGTARERKLDYALSNSFGFGGQNCSLLFGKA
ncbi:beta-ketoacyl-ACP synthase II [Treponema zuelzerae]|uniref:3-oxoacyl-[acyl-carrier-protein] synthase 2 n=1 Tax=Teretinema zuelzerae TaxID=156 RepID=A0AAE3EJA2_9SPIR|nr:beta-ketoacyl-ACP synthase II [Teretinema zuelzerae]MCD1655727.1 beta-ketoacyl-ACP synthase II [Teretinema zuelzerae]